MMSKPFFIINIFLIISTIYSSAYADDIVKVKEKTPIVITSQTLTADNKNKTAVFKGSVVAKTDDLTIHSDKMTVFYDDPGSKIDKIHATGNVKVYNNEKVIFSQEAVYFDNEDKIIFTGNPKVVEGENYITGRQIIFYLKDNRAVIDESRMILQNVQERK